MTAFFRLLTAAVLLCFCAPAFAADAPLLHAMFQDHAVLQRGKPIPVYGQAAPGAHLTISLSGETAVATADAAGQWRVLLAPLPAGGPYTLAVQSDSGARQQIGDVLVGDVYLCSGQSNMGLQVRAAGNAAEEERAATDSQIRELDVATKLSDTPLATFAAPVHWAVESPQTVGNFSASCFYFARELRKSVSVPIGLIHSSWGGSRVRNWVSEQGLRKLGIFDNDLDMLDTYRTDPQAAERRWDATWESWWRAHGKGEPWSPDFDDSSWTVAPPGLGPWAFWTGTSPDGFVGQMWLRTTIDLTAAQAAMPATLDLGSVNEEDESWVDGHGVGGTAWAKTASHEIPADVLHAGRNVIVTNIFCSWRNCGLSGPTDTHAIRFADGASVALTNPWRYAQVPEGVIAPQLPWGPIHGVAEDYNGMIAPIGAYGLRGVVWYQGESNMYFAEHYQTVLAALMADWRGIFGAHLPFLVVQLPDYGPSPTKPTASLWADVREAQRRAVAADPDAALAVTIDIGDPKVLHPADKQEVGRRLSIAARRLIYGDAVAPSGPQPVEARRAGGGIVVSFKDTTGSLVSYSGFPNAFELCGATQASCRFADARIRGDGVVLAGAGQATMVRYCWGDTPICTLSDESGLPAGPFEIAVTRRKSP
jgi:sialate O-acetylesterase